MTYQSRLIPTSQSGGEWPFGTADCIRAVNEQTIGRTPTPEERAPPATSSGQNGKRAPAGEEMRDLGVRARRALGVMTLRGCFPGLPPCRTGSPTPSPARRLDESSASDSSRAIVTGIDPGPNHSYGDGPIAPVRRCRDERYPMIAVVGAGEARHRVGVRPSRVSVWVVKDLPQVPFGGVEKPAHLLDGLQVVVADAVGACLVELVDSGAGHGEQDRRVGGDHELGSGVGGAVDDREQRERPGERERSLGLIEQVQPFGAESVGGEREERLAMGLGMQRNVAVDRRGRERTGRRCR